MRTRLTPRQAKLMLSALRHHGTEAHRNRDFPTARTCAHIIATSLQSLPYDVELTADEWRIVSRALRAGGNSPAAGTEPARWRALYLLLNRRGFTRS